MLLERRFKEIFKCHATNSTLSGLLYVVHLLFSIGLCLWLFIFDRVDY